MRPFLAFAVAGLTLACSVAGAQTINHYAGQPGMAPGINYENGYAAGATLNFPHGMDTDLQGNLYFADRDNHRIRKITFGQQISTVAGSGTLPGMSGDGGLATQATLSQPRDVAVDAAGNLYIVDRGNNRIRKVTAATGVITTFAGTGEIGFSGDGGPATQARLRSPFGIDVDGAGNVIIADTGNNRVRVVGTDGIIWTLGGNGQDGATGDGGPAIEAAMEPFRVDVAPNGEIYFSDWISRVRRIDLSGNVHLVAGSGVEGYSGDGGPATQAALGWPESIAFDAAGNVYFTESFNGTVRRVDAATGIISTYAGTGAYGPISGNGGPAREATMLQPMGLAIDVAGRMFIADFAHVIRVVTTNAPAQQTRVVASFVQTSSITPPLKVQLDRNLDAIADQFEANRRAIGCVGLATQTAGVRLRTALAPFGGIPRADGVTLASMLDVVRNSSC